MILIRLCESSYIYRGISNISCIPICAYRYVDMYTNLLNYDKPSSIRQTLINVLRVSSAEECRSSALHYGYII